MQFVPYQENRPSFGEENIKGFQTGLQSLLNTKMQGMQQQQMGRGLQALGVPGQLAQLPPELLQHIVPKIIEQQGKSGSIDLMKDYFGVKTPQTATGMTGGTSEAGVPSYLLSDEDIARKQAVINKASAQGHEETALKLQTQLDNEKNRKLDWLSKHEEKLVKAETEGYKLEEPIRTLRQDSDAKIQRNQNAREVIEEGDFSNPIWAGIISMFPKNIGQAFLTKDTKVLQAMGPNGFLKDVKPIFGPNISNSDVDEMYKAIISATNTKEQNLAILDMFDKAAAADAAKADLYDEMKERYPNRSIVKNLEATDKEWSKRLRKNVEESKAEATARKESRDSAPEGLKLVGTYKTPPKASDVPDKIQRFGDVYKKSINGQWVEGDYDPVAKIFTPKLGAYPTSSAGLFSKPAQFRAG